MPCVPVLGMKLGSILLVEEKAALTSGDNKRFRSPVSLRHLWRWRRL